VQRGDAEIVELVNVVVDGRATDAERAELETLLETSPETRALFEGVREVARRLEAMPSVEPPRELRPSVLWQIRKKQVESPSRRRVLFGLGWAAAAAIVLAFLFLEQPGRRDTVATMAPIQWPVVAQDAHLIVRHQGDLYALEPLSPGPISIELDRSLTIIGISGGLDASFGKTKANFTLRPSERAAVIVRHQGGAGPAEVRMTVGNQLFTSRFVVPGIDGKQHQQLR
jgi:hypothetical protein